MFSPGQSFRKPSLALGVDPNWLLPSSQEMAQLDAQTIQDGTPSLTLMERAGAAMTEGIVRVLPSLKRCVVLCGPGNNGGDGLVIGRLLRERGLQVHIVIAASARYSGECATQIRKTEGLQSFGGECELDDRVAQELSDHELAALLSSSDVVIDALLGTGQRDAPRGAVRGMLEVAQSCKQARKHLAVVAVDVPSGFDADTGAVYESSVPADYTFTVQYVKRGMLQFPGRALCGEIIAVPIGIEATVPVEFGLATEVSLPLMKSRAPDVHKGLLGRVLIVGGSASMPGAPMLAGLGALRAGAGIVSRSVRRSWSTAPELPEAMFELLDGDDDTYTGRDVPRVITAIKKHDVVVLGPGLCTTPEAGEFVKGLLSGLRGESVAIVIDADALNLISVHAESMAGLNVIITPHPGEAGRLLGVSAAAIQSDRFSAVRKLAECLGVVAVLKGAGTIIHNGKSGMLVAEGTPFLATPGSGDVLAGVIAACIPRCASLFDAAVCGVSLHATAGMRASEKTGGTILASEVAQAVSECIR